MCCLVLLLLFVRFIGESITVNGPSLGRMSKIEVNRSKEKAKKKTQKY
jgi:hypothetical protein